MPLFAHHMKSYLGIEIEVNGKPFPDGPTDHAVVLGVVIVVAILTCYGLYAMVRDWGRWRRRRAEMRVTGQNR